MSQAITFTIEKAHSTFHLGLQHRERIFAMLVASFIFSLCWYSFSLHQAIVYTVERSAVVKEIQAKSTHLAELESNYFRVKNSITFSRAISEGFIEAPVSMFISKKSLSTNVTAGGLQHVAERHDL